MEHSALAKLYVEHIARLAREYGRILSEEHWDGVLIHSGTAGKRSGFDDQYWPLRITPHFQHWLPLALEDCAVLFLPERRPILYKNQARDFWEDPREPDVDFWGTAFEIEDVEGPSRLGTLLPLSGRRGAFIGDTIKGEAWGFPTAARNPPGLVHKLDSLRSTKSDYEIECVALATKRAARGHARLREAFWQGDASELELHLLYLAATDQDDLETPYKNIVALGEHAATLHHVSYDRRARHAESLLVDAGATFLGYASDITRTLAKGTSAAAIVFAELVRRIDALEQEMARRVAIGTPFETLHNQAHELLAPSLRELGLVCASDDELVGTGVTRRFFPHGLGHSLGLQCHDVGCRDAPPAEENPYLRNTSVITAGQVLTIEPGCYFIDSQLAEIRKAKLADRVDWKLVSALSAFGGVRIEDNLAVTAAGVRNLTREVL